MPENLSRKIVASTITPSSGISERARKVKGHLLPAGPPGDSVSLVRHKPIRLHQNGTTAFLESTRSLIKVLAAMDSDRYREAPVERLMHQPWFEYTEIFEEYVLDILL